MVKLKFFDLKARKSFVTDKFTIVIKNGRKFAKTTAPSGVTSMRIVSNNFKKWKMRIAVESKQKKTSEVFKVSSTTFSIRGKR